jgi:hypothetical protein
MAHAKSVPVYEFAFGEEAVWYDGRIRLRAGSAPPHVDPVELSNDEAKGLAKTILRLLSKNAPESS